MKDNQEKFESFFGEKVEMDFLDEVIKFTSEENDELVEGVTLLCYKNRSNIQVGEEISSKGGQGIIYKSNFSDIVIKIYREEYRTKSNEAKLKAMVEKGFINKGICWPLDVLYFHNKFVGFIMPFVRGKDLYSLTANPRRVMDRYPNYDKLMQVKLILSLLKQFEFLHGMNVLVGDVKLENVIFDSNFDPTLIDMDSVQFGKFACEWSTPGYDDPEIILSRGREKIAERFEGQNGMFVFNKYYMDYYRTLKNENFAISVLIYRLLMNGRFPYDHRDWDQFFDSNEAAEEANLELCVNRKFPYSNDQGKTNIDCKEKEIWSCLPSFLKEIFVECFSYNKRLGVSEWIKIFEKYQALLLEGKLNREVFPSSEIEYSQVKFSLDYEYSEKGFTMQHVVEKLLKYLKNDDLKDLTNEISNVLKTQNEFYIYNYKFKLVYNIGILKKIKAIYSPF